MDEKNRWKIEKVEYMEKSKTLMSVFAGIYEKLRKGQLKTLIPLLCLFRIAGKPMNLRMHYQLAPMYNTIQPPQSIYMFARQLGKSSAICSSAGLRSGLVPFYHILMVQTSTMKTWTSDKNHYDSGSATPVFKEASKLIC